MNWTTEKPTKPGWYWCRLRQGRPLWIVRVRTDRSQIMVNVCHSHITLPLDDYTGRTDAQWAGPIKEPTA